MRKNLTIAAVLAGGIIVLMPVTISTPVLAQQTCAEVRGTVSKFPG